MFSETCPDVWEGKYHVMVLPKGSIQRLAEQHPWQPLSAYGKAGISPSAWLFGYDNIDSDRNEIYRYTG